MNSFDNQQFIAIAESLTKEGVASNDIRWWGGLNEKEKLAIKEIDASSRLAFLDVCQQDKIPRMETLLRMMKFFVFYEEYPPREEILNLTFKLGLSENDVALPYELHDRIDKFLVKLSKNKTQMINFQQHLKNFSSFNACLRYEIKNGEI